MIVKPHSAHHCKIQLSIELFPGGTMQEDTTKAQIVSAVLQGIIDSQEQYHKWTGLRLSYAPEYFVTYNIANRIDNLVGKKYIHLENNTKKTMINAGLTPNDKLHKSIRQNGRIDILLNCSDNKPRAIIEVKSPVYGMDYCKEDIERINEILKLDTDINSFKFGIFAFYMATKMDGLRNGDESIEKRYNNLINDKALTKYNFIDVKEIKTGDNYAWLAGCFVFDKPDI